MTLTKTSLYRLIGQIIDQHLGQRGVSGTAKGIIPATYVSGNPKIQRANESTLTFGTKTHKLVAPWSNRNGLKPAASQSVQYSWDQDGNRVVDGPIVDQSGVLVDADYIMGLRPVAPGNTLLLSHDAEVSETSATYTDTVNKFHVTRPGLYRIKVELSRTGGTTRARAVRKLKDGTVVVVTGEATQSTLTYPTFGAVQSLDMTTPVDWGDVIYLQLKNDSGPGQTAYAQNCRVYYADATATFTFYDAAL